MAWFGWALAALSFMGLANLGTGVARWCGPSWGPSDEAPLAPRPRILRVTASRAFDLLREQVAPSGSAGLSASPSDPWLAAR